MQRQREAACFQMGIRHIGKGSRLEAVTAHAKAVLSRAHTNRQARASKTRPKGGGGRDHLGIDRCCAERLDIDEIGSLDLHAGHPRHGAGPNEVFNRGAGTGYGRTNQPSCDGQGHGRTTRPDRCIVCGQHINGASDAVNLPTTGAAGARAIKRAGDLRGGLAQDLVLRR